MMKPWPRLSKRRTAQLAWLRVRPELWADIPTQHEDMTPDQAARLVAIVDALRDEELMGCHGYLEDQKWVVRELVGTLKSEAW